MTKRMKACLRSQKGWRWEFVSDDMRSRGRSFISNIKVRSKRSCVFLSTGSIVPRNCPIRRNAAQPLRNRPRKNGKGAKGGEREMGDRGLVMTERSSGK